jgi:ketosteroid isomerase-like protein
MKTLVTFAFVCIISLITNAQNQDSLDIIDLYDSFENTVIMKDVEAHLDLFSNDEAALYSIIKFQNGPAIFNFSNIESWTDFFAQDFPYQLNISDIQIHVNESFAYTDASFDEYQNEELIASGRDLFGYIKTNEGWKLHILHNTIVLANDTNDYSSPFALNNSVDNILDDFISYHNDLDGDALLSLFAESTNQVLSFNDLLDVNYSVENSYVDQFALDLSNSITERTMQLANIEIYYVDDYLATVFCDYTLSFEDDLEENGKAWFTLIGSLNDGWVFTSGAFNTMDIETSISELQVENQVNVYPNPAIDQIKVNSAIPIESITIIDASGRKLLVDNSGFQEFVSIEMADFNAGIYFVSILLENGDEQIKKLVLK